MTGIAVGDGSSVIGKIASFALGAEVVPVRVAGSWIVLRNNTSGAPLLYFNHVEHRSPRSLRHRSSLEIVSKLLDFEVDGQFECCKA